MLFRSAGGVTANLSTGSYYLSANDNGTLINFEQIQGTAGADALTGDGQRNVLDGMGGADTLIGGAGNDDLWGGAGGDLLIADGGTDMLVGNSSLNYDSRDAASDIFEIRTTASSVTITDFKRGVDKLDLTAFGFDSNGVSPYWTGSAIQTGSTGTTALLTLTGQNAEVVTICLNGQVDHNRIALTDMIGGSASLIPPAPTYPMNGGNAIADLFLVLPQNGNQIINNFENGLDKMDLRQMDMNYWGGFLANAPGSTDAILNFRGDGGEAFTVTLTGVPYWQIDASDYLLA